MLRIFVVDRWHFKNAFQCVALPSHNVLAFIVAAGCCCYCCRWCDCVRVGLFRVCVFVDVSDCVWCVHESDRTNGLFHVLGILCACTERTLRFTVFGWFAFFPLILFRFSFFAFDLTLSHTLIHLRSRSSSVPFTLSLSRSLYAAIWCVFWFLDCLTLWLRVRVCKYVCISPICCVFVLFGVWWFEFFSSSSVVFVRLWNKQNACYNMLITAIRETRFRSRLMWMCVAAINAALWMSSLTMFHRIKYKTGIHKCLSKLFTHKLFAQIDWVTLCFVVRCVCFFILWIFVVFSLFHREVVSVVGSSIYWWKTIFYLLNWWQLI